VFERVSIVTPVSDHVCVERFSRKMWKSWAEVLHMSAHHEPSFHHSTLSARFVPVGVPVPENDWS